MNKTSFAAALALAAATPAMVSAEAEPIEPRLWDYTVRVGNNKPRRDFAKEKARAKTAKKSRRQQRAKR